MGLGLPLCQAIVKAHGSRLEVCDNTPKGTVFKFALSKEEILL
jgi:Osmosensitive K+ channel histidine kinase